MRQITELSFEIIMNKAPHLVENSPSRFLYGKNCSSAVWMKYSIYCGTPSAYGGGWEERVAFMEFGYSAKRGVLLQLQLGGCWEHSRDKGDSVEALWSAHLVRGFRGCWHFTGHPSRSCLVATVTTSWGDFLLVCDADKKVIVFKEVGSHPQGELFQCAHLLPLQWGISWSRSRDWMSVRWLVEFSSSTWLFLGKSMRKLYFTNMEM